MVCLTTVSAEKEVKFPFSCKQQRNKSSWDGCTSCDQLTWTAASLFVQTACASPLPGPHYYRCTGRRELQELERMWYWQGLSLLPSLLQTQVPPSC